MLIRYLFLIGLLLASLALDLPVSRELGVLAQEDYASALRQLETLAADGDVRAAGELGRMYLEGAPTKVDVEAAKRWLEVAARQGHSLAQFQLGVLNAGGYASGYDYEVSKHWLEAATRQWWGPDQ